MNSIERYNHPPTYVSTGDAGQDFKYSFEAYDADIGRFLPESKEAWILDVGCGWGQCISWMKLNGFSNVLGIDVGADQEKHGEALGLDIIRVDDPKAFLKSHAGSFDLVVMNHVIEHVPPDEGLATLRAIHCALKSGGRIVVQTPNMNCVGANAGRYIEISHVTGYSESSLDQLVRLAGFENIELFGNRTTLSLRPKRLAWAALQRASRLAWKLMLIAELGSDAPTLVEKNLYATGTKQG